MRYTTRAELEAHIRRTLDADDSAVVRVDDETVTRLMGGDPQPFCDEHAFRLAFDVDSAEWVFRGIHPQHITSRDRLRKAVIQEGRRNVQTIA